MHVVFGMLHNNLRTTEKKKHCLCAIAILICVAQKVRTYHEKHNHNL